MIQLKATGRLLSVESVEPLTTGSVGIPVELELSSDFDGLTAFLCFRADGVTAEYEVSDAMTVPPQCLTGVGERLLAGVYAEDAESTVIIPTVWAVIGTVCKGTTISGSGPLDPAPTWVQQVIETSEETQAIAQSVRDDADAGVFNGRDGRDGRDGERGPQGIQGIQGVEGRQGETGPRGEAGPRGDTGSDALSVTGPLPLLIPCDQYNYPVSIPASVLQASFFGAHRGDTQIPCRVSIDTMSATSPATVVTRGALTIRVGNQDSTEPMLYVTVDPTKRMDAAVTMFAVYIYPIVDGAYQPVEVRYFQCARSNSGEGTSIFPTAIVMPHPSGSGYQRATISAWQHTYSSIAVGMSLSVKNLPSGMVEVERKDSTATKAATVLVQWPDDGTLAGGATSGNLTLTVTYPNLQSVDVTVPWMVM